MRNGSEAIASSSTGPLRIASCSAPSQSFSVMMVYSFSEPGKAAAFPTSAADRKSLTHLRQKLFRDFRSKAALESKIC